MAMHYAIEPLTDTINDRASVTTVTARSTKVRALVGVSLMALGLVACSGDDAATASSEDEGSLWTWSRPDAWYERSGDGAAAQQQQAAPAASQSAQAGGDVQMTTRTYEIEEVSPVDGRVTRRTVTETVPAAQSQQEAQPAQPVQMADSGTVIPANKLPQSALPPGGFGSSDDQNANYSGAVRGSMAGTVSSGSQSPSQLAMPMQNPPGGAGASSNVLVSSSASGGATSDLSRPLLTSPSLAGAGRSSGGFDNNYLDMAGAVRPQGSYQNVSQRARDFDVQVVDDYDAKWSELDFDGGAQMNLQRQTAAASQAGPAPSAYLPMPQVAAAIPTMPAINSGPMLTNTASVNFAAGSMELTSAIRRKILETALAYRERGGVIELFGQAGAPDQDAANGVAGYDLALTRANRVAAALGEAGVDPSGIRVIVLGITGQAKVDMVLR